MTNEQQLLKNLRQEWTLQTRHCRLLEDEGRALLACDRERYMALQAEHAALLLLIQTQAEERDALMRDTDGNPCPAALGEQFSERTRRLLMPLRDGLHRTLTQAQELSKRNEGLITNELKYIAFMLDLYVEAGRSAQASYGGGVYGRRLLLDRRA